MGENATKIGQVLEGWGSHIFQDMNWIEITRDLQMKCSRRSLHKKETMDWTCYLNTEILTWISSKG